MEKRGTPVDSLPGGLFRNARAAPADAPHRFRHDITAISSIAAVPSILEVLVASTGLRVAFIARITHDAWTACAVLDGAGFGLKVGDQLDVETTL